MTIATTLGTEYQDPQNGYQLSTVDVPVARTGLSFLRAFSARPQEKAALFANSDPINADQCHRRVFLQGGGRVEFQAHEPELVTSVRRRVGAAVAAFFLSGGSFKAAELAYRFAPPESIRQGYTAYYFQNDTDTRPSQTDRFSGTGPIPGEVHRDEAPDLADQPQAYSWETVSRIKAPPRSMVLIGRSTDDRFATGDVQAATSTRQENFVRQSTDVLVQHMAGFNAPPEGAAHTAVREPNAGGTHGGLTSMVLSAQH